MSFYRVQYRYSTCTVPVPVLYRFPPVSFYRYSTGTVFNTCPRRDRVSYPAGGTGWRSSTQRFMKKPPVPRPSSPFHYDLLPTASHSIHMVETFSLRNVCVIFRNESSASYRPQFLSRPSNPLQAVIHGFSEYAHRYSRITTVRPANKDEVAHLSTCNRHELGVALYFQSNNMFHAMFHAPPAWQHLLEHVRQVADHVFIPLVGYVAGRAWVKPPEWKAHAWEFSLRALTAKATEEIARDLGKLLSATCTCFGRVEGSTGYFSLASRQRSATLPVLHGWRSSALEHARAAVRLAAVTLRQNSVTHASLRALFIKRTSGSRVIVNQIEVDDALRLLPMVQIVIMETLTLCEQILLASSAQTLIGVHGQALSHMVFLPPSPTRTAFVEILPKISTSVIRNKQHYMLLAELEQWQAIYLDWTFTTGTKHLIVHAQVNRSDTNCKPFVRRKAGGGLLRCNVTVPIGKFVRQVRSAVHHVCENGELSGCAQTLRQEGTRSYPLD